MTTTSAIFQKLAGGRQDFSVSSLRFDSTPHFAAGKMWWERIKFYIPLDEDVLLQMWVQEQMQHQQIVIHTVPLDKYIAQPNIYAYKFDVELTDWNCALRGCFINDVVYSDLDDIVVSLRFDHCGPLSKSPLHIECNGMQITTW